MPAINPAEVLPRGAADLRNIVEQEIAESVDKDTAPDIESLAFLSLYTIAQELGAIRQELATLHVSVEEK